MGGFCRLTSRWPALDVHHICGKVDLSDITRLRSLVAVVDVVIYLHVVRQGCLGEELSGCPTLLAYHGNRSIQDAPRTNQIARFLVRHRVDLRCKGASFPGTAVVVVVVLPSPAPFISIVFLLFLVDLDQQLQRVILFLSLLTLDCDLLEG